MLSYQGSREELVYFSFHSVTFSTNEHTCLCHLREHPPYLSTVSVLGAPARVPHAAPSIFHYLLRFASLPGVVFSYSSRFLQRLCPLFMLGRASIPCSTGKTTRLRSRGTVTYVTHEIPFMIHRRLIIEVHIAHFC